MLPLTKESVPTGPSDNAPQAVTREDLYAQLMCLLLHPIDKLPVKEMKRALRDVEAHWEFGSGDEWADVFELLWVQLRIMIDFRARFLEGMIPVSFTSHERPLVATLSPCITILSPTLSPMPAPRGWTIKRSA